MMNDPFAYEREIDAIRAKLYEESLPMSRDEWHRKISGNAHELAKQFGFKIIPSAGPQSIT